MRWWLVVLTRLLVLSVAACSFHTTNGATPITDAHAGSADAMADAMAVHSDAALPRCDTSDPSLKLCLEFDEGGLATATTALDGSGLHHDPTIANVTVATRTVPMRSQAVQTAGNTSMSIAPSSDFDLQQFTLSAWIKHGGNPPMQQGVVDTGKQYTLSIDNNGNVVCAVSHNGTTFGLVPGAPTNTNEWDVVACTYDGSQLCAWTFQNGSSTAMGGCGPFSQSIDTNGGFGTTIASWAQTPIPPSSHFIGSIDQVRIYGRALTSQELCTAAGLANC